LEPLHAVGFEKHQEQLPHVRLQFHNVFVFAGVELVDQSVDISDVLGVLVFKEDGVEEKFIQNDPEGEVVLLELVLAFQHFRRDLEGGADQSVESGVALHESRIALVYQVEVGLVDEHVARLDVAVDHAHLIHLPQGIQTLPRHEPQEVMVLGQAVQVFHAHFQVVPPHELQHLVLVPLIL